MKNTRLDLSNQIAFYGMLGFYLKIGSDNMKTGMFDDLVDGSILRIILVIIIVIIICCQEYLKTKDKNMPFLDELVVIMSSTIMLS